MQNVARTHWSPVIAGIFLLLSHEHGSLDGCADKKPFASTITINCRGWSNAGLRIAPHRTGCDARVNP
jgi:hypothetical protein